MTEMLENGMIVGASKYDKQDQPMLTCPVCKDSCWQLVNTVDGFMCPDCEDEFLDANKSDFIDDFIDDNKEKFHWDWLDSLTQEDRLKVLGWALLKYERTHPVDVAQFRLEWIEENELDFKRFMQERLEYLGQEEF